MRDALTAAREWGARPTEMLGIPSRPWSEADRLLSQALTIHDADRCPGGCGHYLDETSEVDGWHTAHTLTCDACAARDALAEQGQRQPGELVWVSRDSAGKDEAALVVAHERPAALDGAGDHRVGGD